MREYHYVALTASQAIKQGTLSGASPEAVRRELGRRGWRLVDIHEAPATSIGVHLRGLSGLRFTRSIRSLDIELLLQQLALMLESGLELTASLRELGTHASKPRVQRLCHRLATSIEQGDSLAEAIDASRQFPLIVSRMAAVGEQTGQLGHTLQRASDFLEKRRQAIGRVRTALAYPTVVATAAIGVAGYLVVYAIPKLSVFLSAMGRKLPAMTQSLLDVSEVLRTHGPRATIIVAGCLIGLALLYLWKPARYRIDQCLLRIPLLGRLIQMSETQQLANTLALMLRCGVLLQDALETASKVHSNHYLAEQVCHSRRQIAAGKDLAGALRESQGFSNMLPSMAAVGEQTGDLAQSMERLAKFYSQQLEAALKRTAGLVEPGIIVFVGGIVGYVYIAFFLALISAGANFK